MVSQSKIEPDVGDSNCLDAILPVTVSKFNSGSPRKLTDLDKLGLAVSRMLCPVHIVLA
jgi:hypothetical protein